MGARGREAHGAGRHADRGRKAVFTSPEQSRLLRVLVVCSLAAVACGDNSEPAGSTASAVHTAAPLPQAEYRIEIATPQSVDPLEVVLAASRNISVGPRARISSMTDSPSVITNVGESGIRIGERARIGTAWSRSEIVLGPHAQVAGTLYTPEVDNRHDATIAGGVVTSAEFDPLALTELNIQFPPATAERVRVRDGHSTERDPGRYGSVRLAPRSQLTLRTGAYYLERQSLPSLFAEHSQATLADGRVVIHN